MVSCAIVFAMHMMALHLSSERLVVGRPIILAAGLVMRVSLAVCDSGHVEKTGGTVEDGLLWYDSRRRWGAT